MSSWLSYLLAFLFFFTGASICALFAQVLTRKFKVSDKALALRATLPGHDCGLCGAVSCKSFADALLGGKVEVGRCAPGGTTVEKRLRSILDGSLDKARVAVIRCGATKAESPDLFEYSGIADCSVAQSIYGGPRTCTDSCLGYGSCIPYCPVAAISFTAGTVTIDPEICTGCGACTVACPTGVISLVPAEDALFVACNSKLSVGRRMKICEAACNGCHACEQPVGAPSFVVKEGLASRSDWKIADAASFMRSCPTGVIREPRGASKSGGIS
ncbi:MAG TPA: 4Fe-4S dicluster domain-containing protein [Rectinemataceae bacterium]|nr:4Fe-4S dicluster domain-containing protein [Rectinemataceae bacterium]